MRPIPYIGTFSWKAHSAKFYSENFFMRTFYNVEILTRGKYVELEPEVEEYGRDWCIRGCHVYHEVWEAATGAATP